MIRTKIVLLLLALTASYPSVAGDYDPNRLRRLVPDFFPIKEVLYHRTVFATCSVAIFALEEGFSKKVRKKGVQALRNAVGERRVGTRHTGKPFSKPPRLSFYGKWRKTPMSHGVRFMSSFDKRLRFTPKCLVDSRKYIDMYYKYLNFDVGGYFNTDSKRADISNGNDLILYVPERNLVLVSLHWH